MILKSIALTNFRCFDEISVEFDKPVSYLIGRNAVGKSSIVDGIRWALTRVCRGTTAAGHGAESLVRFGQNPGTMAVVLETDAGRIERLIGADPNTKKADKLLAEMGIRPEVVMACLAWDVFINLPPADSRALLLSVLDVSVDGAKVGKLLGDDIKEIRQIKFTGPDSIAAAYKAVYASRSAVNKEIKALVVPDLSKYPDFTQGWSVMDATNMLADMKEDLGALEQQLEEAAADVGQSEGRKEGEKVALEHSLSKTQREIADLRRRRDLLGDVPAVAPLEKQLKAAQKRSAEAKAVREVLTTKLAGLEAVHEQLSLRQRAMLLDKAKAAHTCPTCSTKLTKDQYNGILASTVNEILACETDADKVKADLDLHDKIDTEAKVKEAEKALAAVTEKEKSVAQMDEQLHALSEQSAELQAKIAGLDAEPGPEQPTLPTGLTTADLEAIRSRVAKGRVIVPQVEEYIRARREFDETGKRLKDLTEQQARLNRLVEALEPKGKVITELVTPRMEPFFKTVNGALAPFGYRADAELQEGFELAVSKGDGPFIPLRLISDSERLRLGLAIQIAFAVSSGFGLIVTDEASRLDAEGRAELITTIDTALTNGLKQAIVAGSLSVAPEDFQDPEIPGWEFMLVGE